MKVKIKRLDKSLPLPEYQTEGSVGFDLYARGEHQIAPRSVELIPTNLIVETPPGYMLIIVMRSSAPARKGLILPNGIGIVDQDYHGEEDELKVQVYNISDKLVMVEKKERIAQGIFVKINKAEWGEVDEMSAESRGGFGSTG
jgi:dUTP pyrophosphatase